MNFDYKSITIGYYDKIFARHRGIQSKWHHQKFERLARLIPPGVQHLDIGCGPGTFIGMLASSVKSIGVDISPQQIKYAKTRYGTVEHCFQVCTADSLPFLEGSFDVVTSIELIEHITQEHVLGLFREIRRVLKPGGEAIITTPNYGSAWPLLELIVDRVGAVSYAEQHINKYCARRLRRELEETGFASVEVSAYMFAAPFMAWLGWNIADRIRDFEPEFLIRRKGLLLLARARR